MSEKNEEKKKEKFRKIPPLCRYFNPRPWTREMIEMAFRKRRKARKRIRCYICGLEKEMSVEEFVKHLREHIKRGDLKYPTKLTYRMWRVSRAE